MADFDPYKVPAALVAYLVESPEVERERASTEWAKRAVAAAHVLAAVGELRAALAKHADPRLSGAIGQLVEVARDLHDYDPTSD